jgi:flagellar basal body-associated protein FliL
MSPESTPSRRLLIGLVLVAILVAAALWLPGWWEGRLFRQAEKIAGVGSAILTGNAADARRKIDSGMTAEKVEGAIGRASFAVRTQGTSTHEIWTYYYKDGTLTVNLTDGVVQRIAVAFGPPRMPTSLAARP